MFYVSGEAETALREVAKEPVRDAGLYAIRTFRTLRNVRILDLTGIPRVPERGRPAAPGRAGPGSCRRAASAIVNGPMLVEPAPEGRTNEVAKWPLLPSRSKRTDAPVSS